MGFSPYCTGAITYCNVTGISEIVPLGQTVVPPHDGLPLFDFKRPWSLSLKKEYISRPRDLNPEFMLVFHEFCARSTSVLKNNSEEYFRGICTYLFFRIHGPCNQPLSWAPSKILFAIIFIFEQKYTDRPLSFKTESSYHYIKNINEKENIVLLDSVGQCLENHI